MNQFNKGRKPNGFGGGRPKFGRPQGRNFNERREGGRPQMHQAVCAECGSRCEVPFKPTGDKPVYCSDCFGNSPNYGSQRAKGDRNFGVREQRGPQMHQAICNECGDSCEVPFRPNGDKPVLCSDCFRGTPKEKHKGAESKSFERDRVPSDELKALQDEVKQLSTKLDKVLNLLQRTSPVKEVTVLKSGGKNETLEKPAQKKVTTIKVKKTTPKKAPKKAAPAKKTVKKGAKKVIKNEKTTVKKKASSKK